MTITLTGIMGCGKSSTGKELARILGWEFLDLDEYIEHKTGQSISDIFSEGEEKFRAIEAEAARDVVTMSEITGSNLVLALGGGTFCNPVVRDFLLERTETIWLKADTETLQARLDSDNRRRPVLERTSIGSLLEERSADYSLAGKWIDTDAYSPEQTAQTIAQWSR